MQAISEPEHGFLDNQFSLAINFVGRFLLVD